MSTPQSRWNARNRDVVNAAKTRWRERNPDKVKAQNERRDPEYRRAWWAANGKEKKYYVKWREKNRHKSRVMSSNRRKTVREGKISFDIIDLLLERQDYECAYSLHWCKVDFLFDRFEVDHIMPLALGGKHENDNIQLLCLECNRRKAAKHPDTFVLQELERRVKLRRGSR